MEGNADQTGHYAFSGSIAENYEARLAPVMFSDYAEIMAERAASLMPFSLLETAAGTGLVTRALRNRLPASVALTATDIAQDMLALAARKFTDAEGVTLAQADAQALPYDDGAFDCVLCQFGVMFYPDKDASFREAFRVLRPGGSYLFSLWDAMDCNPFARIWYDVLFLLTDGYMPPLQPFAYRFDMAKGSALAAGFDRIEASVLRLTKAIADPEAFARGLTFGPAAAALDARGLDKDRIVALTTEKFTAELGKDPCPIDLQAIFMTAQRPPTGP